MPQRESEVAKATKKDAKRFEWYAKRAGVYGLCRAKLRGRAWYDRPLVDLLTHSRDGRLIEKSRDSRPNLRKSQ